jgi:hypothetical protein
VIYSLLSNLRFDDHFGTFDADAIEIALDLASISQVRGPKKVFVLTDGYGTRSSLMNAALHRAQNDGVDVIGLSVGFGKSFVSQVYQHYIIAAIPSGLPDAFQAFAEQNEEDHQKEIEDSFYTASDANEDAHGILRQHRAVFPDISKDLKVDRDLKLVAGNNVVSPTIVDLCFAIDITGSMLPFLRAIKAQVKGTFFGKNENSKHPQAL